MRPTRAVVVTCAAAAVAACEVAFPMAGFEGPPVDGVDAGAEGGNETGGDGAAEDGRACDADLSTDPNRCGSCDHSCRGDGCEAGACAPTVATELPQDILATAIDGDFIYLSYVTGASTAAIARVALFGTGSVPTPLVTGEARSVDAAPPVAVRGESLYWATTGATGAVKRCDKSTGGNVTVLAGSESSPRALATTSTHVYWTHAGGVRRLPLDAPAGAAPEPFATSASPAIGVAASETTLAWTSNDGAVHIDRLGGGAPLVLTAAAATAVGAIAVVGDDVYFTTSNDTLGHARADGAPVPAMPVASTPLLIVADARTILWSVDRPAPEGAVMMCDAPSCTGARLLAGGQSYPIALSMSPSAAVWGAQSIDLVRAVR